MCVDNDDEDLDDWLLDAEGYDLAPPTATNPETSPTAPPVVRCDAAAVSSRKVAAEIASGTSSSHGHRNVVQHSPQAVRVPRSVTVSQPARAPSTVTVHKVCRYVCCGRLRPSCVCTSICVYSTFEVGCLREIGSNGEIGIRFIDAKYHCQCDQDNRIMLFLSIYLLPYFSQTTILKCTVPVHVWRHMLV